MTIKLAVNGTMLREDKRNGHAVVMRGEGISPLCLVKGVYDAALKCWKPDYEIGLHFPIFVHGRHGKTLSTSRKKLRWPQNKVTHLGARFSRGYGLGGMKGIPYFLSIDWDDEKVLRLFAPTEPHTNSF